jgi:hypothetical protein
MNKPHRPIRTTAKASPLILAAALLGGCAGQPLQDAKGREVVWVHSVDWDAARAARSGTGAAFSGIGGMFGLGLAGHLVANLAGRAVGHVVDGAPNQGKVAATYFYSDKPKIGEIGGSISWREPWPGAERVLPKRWAILTKDEKGKILLPCDDPCEPVRSGEKPVNDRLPDAPSSMQEVSQT